ncbi:MAG: glycosyltransferase [Gemmatimonadaceae bacterium]|jgi:glycosyltransferase involved in cell wall biosynthesis|nr:glycosyltransferase [Gemmatimonadaceae bacterium]
MRVLFVTHNIPRAPGDAAGSFVLRLAAALRTAGHDVRALAPHAEGLADRDEIDGVPITRVHYAAPARETLAYTGTMAEAVRASWGARGALLGLIRAMARATRQWMRGEGDAGWRPDVLHAHWWFPSGLALVTPTRPSTPFVVTMHGSDVRLARTVPGGGLLAGHVLHRARVRTAVSTWLARQAERFHGGPVEVAPMPIDLTRFTPDPPLAREERSLLFVGRLNRQKGVAQLLDAFAAQSAQTRLTIVGDGPDRAALHAHARALGVFDRIHWIGAVTQPGLPELYRRASLVVMPSIQEGLGLVGVEAQACGTPVVGFASGGLPDVVAHETTGLLVPEGDTRALAGALGALLDDPARRTAMAHAGLAHVAERFAPARVAARYAAYYEQAISR